MIISDGTFASFECKSEHYVPFQRLFRHPWVKLIESVVTNDLDFRSMAQAARAAVTFKIGLRGTGYRGGHATPSKILALASVHSLASS
ncbi:hypothetical protein IG631_12784 [Alternaria alternata]|nr:hypothetical protein IG631_12784 [Alternaria alternata]